MNEPRDELLERYADAVAQDTRRPPERVRNAARAHAQMLRDQTAMAQRAQSVAPPKPAANQPQWTVSLVASLAVVGLAGLLYVQIDRGTPEDRDAALGTAAQMEAPSSAPAASPAPPARADAPPASPPPESPTQAMEARQRPANKPLAAAPPIVHSPAVAAPPAKSAAKSIAIARQEVSPSPVAAPVQDAAQATMANATAGRVYSTPPVEADAPPKTVSKAADQLAGAGAMRDAKSATSAESVARAGPPVRSAAVMAPAAPAPAAPAIAAPVPRDTQRRARETEAGSATAQFMEAVRTGHTETMQKLLVQGVAVNTRDDKGNTALMLAVRHRQAAAVRKLLAMGADTSLVNYEGLTALQLANQLGLADMAQLLQAAQ